MLFAHINNGLNIAVWIFTNARPILLAPRFGLDDSDHADFDATLMLATMLGSQLGDAENSEIGPPQVTMNPRVIPEVNDTGLHNAPGPRSSSQNTQRVSILSTKSTDEQSNHTKVWSEISGIGQPVLLEKVIIPISLEFEFNLLMSRKCHKKLGS